MPGVKRSTVIAATVDMITERLRLLREFAAPAGLGPVVQAMGSYLLGDCRTDAVRARIAEVGTIEARALTVARREAARERIAEHQRKQRLGHCPHCGRHKDRPDRRSGMTAAQARSLHGRTPIGALIKRAIREAGMTVDAAANAMRVEPKRLYDISVGNVQVSSNMKLRITHFLLSLGVEEELTDVALQASRLKRRLPARLDAGAYRGLNAVLDAAPDLTLEQVGRMRRIAEESGEAKGKEK